MTAEAVAMLGAALSLACVAGMSGLDATLRFALGAAALGLAAAALTVAS